MQTSPPVSPSLETSKWENDGGPSCNLSTRDMNSSPHHSLCHYTNKLHDAFILLCSKCLLKLILKITLTYKEECKSQKGLRVRLWMFMDICAALVQKGGATLKEHLLFSDMLMSLFTSKLLC